MVVIAAIGTAAANLPGLDRIGPLACSILIAVLYRQFLGYPTAIRSGIQFSSKRLLRLAIVLYGLRLNIDVTMLIAKWLKAEKGISLLLGIGTGVFHYIHFNPDIFAVNSHAIWHLVRHQYPRGDAGGPRSRTCRRKAT